MTRPRLRRGEGAQLRHEILAATRALIEESGSTEQLSVRSIAERVGVTAPSIYLHFSDKDELVYFTCREMFSSFADRLQLAFDADGSTVDRLVSMGRAYVKWGLENAAVYPVLFNGDIAKPTEIEDDPGLSILASLILMVQAGMAEGSIPSDRKPEAVAWGMWSGVHGLVMLLINSKPWVEEHARVLGMADLVPGNDDLIETVLDGLTRGLMGRGIL